MTHDLIERVARAICRSFLFRSGFGLSEAGIEWIVEQKWPEWIPEARASIAIQRELIQQLRDALEWCRDINAPDAKAAAADPAIAAADAALKDTK